MAKTKGNKSEKAGKTLAPKGSKANTMPKGARGKGKTKAAG